MRFPNLIEKQHDPSWLPRRHNPKQFQPPIRRLAEEFPECDLGRTPHRKRGFAPVSNRSKGQFQEGFSLVFVGQYFFDPISCDAPVRQITKRRKIGRVIVMRETQIVQCTFVEFQCMDEQISFVKSRGAFSCGRLHEVETIQVPVIVT